MQYILSLPPSLAGRFVDISGLNPRQWSTVSDPQGHKLGSGGGTVWALDQCAAPAGKHIVIHAGGQGRRLPAYAPQGKLLTPIPVFRWGQAQRVDQTLLELAEPLYTHLMGMSSPEQNTLVASGDAFVRTPALPSHLPEADVVCLGIWTQAQHATHHGVFFVKRSNEDVLDFMLQKPSAQRIEELSATHLYLMDVGVWVLSDRAVECLKRKCGWTGRGYRGGNTDEKGAPIPMAYDLYSDFGTALGLTPSAPDKDLSDLSVAILRLDNGEFYHFGTSRDMLASMETLQNRVLDQRTIWHKKVKPQQSIFVQNARCDYAFSQINSNIWIENAYVGGGWLLTNDNIVTGVPNNKWDIALRPGQCLDICPIKDSSVTKYAVRPYGIDDPFRGSLPEALFLGQPFERWLSDRGITLEMAHLNAWTDIQAAPIFPLLPLNQLTEDLVLWMLNPNHRSEAARTVWLNSPRISADEISDRADLTEILAQRNALLRESLPRIESNWVKSIFYQTDLRHTADIYSKALLGPPDFLPEDAPAILRMKNSMFRSEVLYRTALMLEDTLGEEPNAGERVAEMRAQAENANEEAFGVLRQTILSTVTTVPHPKLTLRPDQIVWASSPARLDIAGGWSDTPPFCIQNGGSVVTLAVNLNGQPPIQVFVRICEKPTIILRSIDTGMREEITETGQLVDYARVGSVFSIAKAALCLSGFAGANYRDPAAQHADLAEALKAFGGGLEISQLVAIPKGSGLGTSSILAATVLGALGDAAGLGWSRADVCHRTFLIEQMLTTGGGWQDQYGGVFHGVKLLSTEPGSQSQVDIQWLHDRVFTSPELQPCWLLYYTGITRVAKDILGQIVRGMFLGEASRNAILNKIKQHSADMSAAISRQDFRRVGLLLRRSWSLNRALDAGTTTAEINAITDILDPHALGYKLLGAGGGGYMIICARTPADAELIRKNLTFAPVNSRARFVDMAISQEGLKIIRS